MQPIYGLKKSQESDTNVAILHCPGVTAQSVKLNEQPAMSTYLVNDSPGGGKETDWMITVARPEGMVYFVCTAPQAEFEAYHKACGAALDSVRFR